MTELHCWLNCSARSMASLANCCPGPGASFRAHRKVAYESVKSEKTARCSAWSRRGRRPRPTAATSASKASLYRLKWMPRPAHTCPAAVLRCDRSLPPYGWRKDLRPPPAVPSPLAISHEDLKEAMPAPACPGGSLEPSVETQVGFSCFWAASMAPWFLGWRVAGGGWCRLQWFAGLNETGCFGSCNSEFELQGKLARLIGWGGIIANGPGELRLTKFDTTSFVVPCQPINLN